MLVVTASCSGRTPSRQIGAATGVSPVGAAGQPARLRGGALLGTGVVAGSLGRRRRRAVGGIPFYGAQARARQRQRRPGRPWRPRTPWPAGPRWAPRGPRSGRRRAEGGWVGPSCSAQLDRIGFFRNIFQCKTNVGNAQKMSRGTKNTQRITKIPRKFLEID
jgi:hypothetical protein